MSTLTVTYLVDWRAIYSIFGSVFFVWTIGPGLLVKYFLTRHLTHFSWSKCVIADVAINAGSALVLAPFPIATIVWAMGLWQLLKGFPGLEEGHPVQWGGALASTSLLAGAVEWLILRVVFGTGVDRSGMWLLTLANALCLVIAALATLFYVLAHPLHD